MSPGARTAWVPALNQLIAGAPLDKHTDPAGMAVFGVAGADAGAGAGLAAIGVAAAGVEAAAGFFAKSWILRVPARLGEALTFMMIQLFFSFYNASVEARTSRGQGRLAPGPGLFYARS